MVLGSCCSYGGFVRFTFSAHRLGACAAVALAASVFVVSSAVGHDTKAPAHASHNWLPKIDWVAFHWSPVDEKQLAAALKMTHLQLYELQADDHIALDTVAKRQGINPAKLRSELFKPWNKAKLTSAQARAIKRRISLVLSQPHLAQHVFWHPFHSPAYKRDPDRSARKLFGVSVDRYRQLRREGRTQLEIATIGGRSETTLRRTVVQHLKLTRDYGIRTRQVLPAQAMRIYNRQRSLVECWMRTPLPQFDPTIPFGGDIHGGHGAHDRLSRIGIVTPKPASGCWTPIIPGNEPKEKLHAGGGTTAPTAEPSTAMAAMKLYCDL